MIGAKETQNIYLKQLEREFEGLSAGGPAWVREIREPAMRAFVDLDFPTTRQEAWKYTNVSPIANAEFPLASRDTTGLDLEAARQLLPGGENAARLVFVDGHFSKALSSESASCKSMLGSLATFIRSAEPAVVANLGQSASYSHHA